MKCYKYNLGECTKDCEDRDCDCDFLLAYKQGMADGIVKGRKEIIKEFEDSLKCMISDYKRWEKNNE